MSYHWCRTGKDTIRHLNYFLSVAITAVCLVGCTDGSTTTPTSTATPSVTSIDLNSAPEANLELGQRSVVIAGGGAGLPGEVSAANGLGTDVTVHLRCLGDVDATLELDDRPIDDTPEAVPCDGQQHDLELALESGGNRLGILPASDGAGDTTAWAVAVTDSKS